MNLLQKLKAKRGEIAEREGKELFMVFHNSTLEETAFIMPKTKTELAAIKGWGKKKIEKYGKEILSLINENYDSLGEPGQGELLSFPDTSRKKKESGGHAKKEEAPNQNSITNNWRESVQEKIFEVGEFIDFINNIVSGLGQLKIKGEISEVSLRQGNAYLKLKDTSGRDYILNCLMWRWDVEYFTHLLEEGLEVIIQGVPGIYKKGNFNIIVKKIEPVGEGAWKKALEELKKKLGSKGYFDPSRKKPIPEFVKTIGLITSESGEAVNDFRRNVGDFSFKINLFDARVEGDYAESSLIQAIKWFNLNAPETDVIALVRGGGSFESLKAFNSEKLAETIISSHIPIIAGIGHEGDETIADYAADKRCSTPTAVAELLKNNRKSLILKIEDISYDLVSAVEELAENLKEKIREFNDLLFSSLGRIFDRFRRLEFLMISALHGIEQSVQKNRHLFTLHSHTMARVIERKIEISKNLISNLQNSLQSLNPENVLARGYSIIYTEKGIIKEASEASVGEKITVKLSKGFLKSRVEEIQQ